MTTITLGGNYRNTSSAATSAPDTTQEIQGRPAVTGNRPTSSEIAEFEALEYTLPRVPGHLIAHLNSESTSSFPFSTGKSTAEVKDAWCKDDNPEFFDLDKLAEKYTEANKSGVDGEASHVQLVDTENLGFV